MFRVPRSAFRVSFSACATSTSTSPSVCAAAPTATSLSPSASASRRGSMWKRCCGRSSSCDVLTPGPALTKPRSGASTPSTWAAAHPRCSLRTRWQCSLRRCVTSLGSAVTPSRDVFEVTLEANPEDVTPAHATAWRRAGVNRVSLGAQSFDDRVLTWMHRSHDAARIGAAVQALRGAGIDNISLDLIFALPAELQRDWERDLDLALALRPTHLSLYGLTVEPRTPLDRWISRGATHAPDEERY